MKTKQTKKTLGLPSGKSSAIMPTAKSVRASLVKAGARDHAQAQATNGSILAEINPKKGDRYSPNLHAYLKKISQHVVPLQRVYRDANGSIWLGWIDEEACFVGAHLNGVLCNGAEAQRVIRGAYSGRDFVKSLKEVQGFWEKYEKSGWCAIDPEHKTPFVGDTRWNTKGNTRTCLWCGQCKQKLEEYEVREIKTRWVSIK